MSSKSNLAKDSSMTTTTYVLKNENDEAVIVTSSTIQSPVAHLKPPMTSNTGSKHKRGPLNIHSVLEEINNNSRDNRENSRNASGHFNLLKTSYVPPLSQP